MRYILLIIFLFACAVQAISQKSKGDIHFDQAKKLIGEGDSKKALKSLTSAQEEYLKESNYYRYFVATQSLVMYYQDTNDGQSAKELINTAFSRIPKNSPDNQSIHAKLWDNLAYTNLYLFNLPEEAVKNYTESINLYKLAGALGPDDLGFEYVNRSIAYNTLSQYKEAVDDMVSAIAIYEKDSNTTPTHLAQHYLSLGTNQQQLGNFEKAIASIRKALQLCPAEDHELLAKIHNDLGITYEKQDRFDIALEELNKARTIVESDPEKDTNLYAAIIINIGNVYKGMGDLDQAILNYKDVLDIYQKTPPSSDTDLIDLIINLSQVTGEIGMSDESKTLLSKAHQLAVDSYGSNSLEEADVLMSLAVAAFNHGEYDESLNYNFKALSIMEEKKYPYAGDYAQIYNNLGQAYDMLIDFTQARLYKEKALELYKKLYGPHHASTAMAIGNIGLSYEAEGLYDKALEFLQQSLTIRLKVQAPDHDDVGTTYMNIGLVYLKKNQPTEAVQHLEKARPIFDKHTKHIMKSMVYNRLAAGYDLLGKKSQGYQLLQKALVANVLNFEDANPDAMPKNPEFLSYYEMIITYTSKVNYDVDIGQMVNLERASRVLDEADRIIKEKALRLASARDRLILAQLNGVFTESGMKLADKLYQRTKNPKYLEKAFYYSERSKANELFADIQDSRAVTISKIPKKLSDQRTALSQQMSGLQQQLATAYSSGNQALITKLKSKDFDLSKEFSALEAQINAQSPAYGMMTGTRTLPSWNEVKTHIGAKTALISYVITDSAKYILIGSSDHLVLKSIPSRTDFDKLVRGYSNQIKYQSASLKEARTQLTDLLWSPVEAALSEFGLIEKIIIIPDGPLNYVPFESLGHDSYLVEKYAMHYQLSGAMMIQMEPKVAKGKPSFIAIAPIFEDTKTNFVNKSCERFVSRAKATDSTTRAFSLNGDYIAPLPATEDEVEKINQLHVDKGIFSKYFTKEAAREELIKSGDLANYDYIHFATHGFVNSQYPELSGLLLSQDTNSAEDGILYSGEILSLTLKAELITLSACETALGKKIEGEGVRGLTTAFLFAGARSVIASLWKVADESTANLMIEFYTQLLSGKDKADALRLAKLSLLKNPKYSHPYYWAPFVQIGGN